MTTGPGTESTAWDGVAFHPELPHGRASGRILLEPSTVRFVSRTGSGDPPPLPLEGLRLRLGGANDRMLFLEHRSRPDLSLATVDLAFLDHPVCRAGGALADQAAAIRTRRRRRHLGTAAVISLVLVALAGVWAAKDALVGVVVRLVPSAVEIEIGKLAWGQVQATTPIVHDPAIDAELERLAAPLLAVLPDTGYDFRLHLADASELNAFALPGGHIVLHSGLVLAAGSGSEVLGVLAHEIAHVTERHTLNQLVGSVGLFVAVQTLFGDLSGVAAVLAEGGFRLATLEFSRDHEREADAVGWATLLAAGIDPRGMIVFFERLEAQEREATGELGGALGEHLGFLSTHPATGERIAELETRARQLPDRLGRRRAEEADLALAALRDRILGRLEPEQSAPPVAPTDGG